MKICQFHWDELRQALKDRGLDHLGAKNAQEAIVAMATDLEGRGAENEYDPLMSCNWMIMSQGLEMCGLSLIGLREDGTPHCPICEAGRSWMRSWIDGPADAALEECKVRGLLP